MAKPNTYKTMKTPSTSTSGPECSKRIAYFAPAGEASKKAEHRRGSTTPVIKLLLAGVVCFICAVTGHAFSLYKDVFSIGNIDETYGNNSSSFSDTLFGPPPASTGDQFVIWPSAHATITWTLDPSFKSMFSASDLLAVSNQIALAFQSWQNASSPIYDGSRGYDSTATSVIPPSNITPPNVPTDFGDIRTIALHEIGHALGLAHSGPLFDPVFPFGVDPSTGSHQSLDLFYAVANPPSGMVSASSSYFPDGQAGTPVMNDFISKGEYRRILTWDELNAYNYIYGSTPFTFMSIPYVASASANGSTADIRITAGFLSSASTVDNTTPFANTVVYGDFIDSSSPGSITSATITFNRNSAVKIGYEPEGINWDFKIIPSSQGNPNAFSVHSVQITTVGTDETTPDSAPGSGAYWDNEQSNPNYIFNYNTGAVPGVYPYGPPTGVSLALDGSGDKNQVQWTWTLPGTIAATDIPAGTDFHPGLRLDLNNWYPVSGFASSIGNFKTQALTPMAAVMDYFGNGTIIGSIAHRLKTEANNLTYAPASSTNTAPGLGISLIASAAPQSVISQLQYADVTGMGLDLSNLNETGLQTLSSNGLVTTVTNFGVHTLGPFQRFALVLQGTTNSLPPDIATNGNYLIMNRPDLVTRELFLAWQSTNSGSICENFALVGQPAYGSVPLLTISAGNNTNLVAWPYPSTGYVLQQTSNLLDTNWVNVSTTPTVAINSSLGVYENQVMVPSSGTMFFRLISP
jgi:hypothetical protein